uniref:multiple organellar RNA editing factor 7, mitochondrial n=1 Tax=Erigeron canadensis TaxID=72917 RepID=UPI001CB9395C|nr:multiple organellar RNA editing factor 7, mitochondrial [Erigeron canadensis]
MFALKVQGAIIAQRVAVSRCLTSIRQCWSTACPPPIESAPAPIDGCDYNHWLVVMDPPTGYPTRLQIVQRYIQTLASAFGGSEEEAKKSMYSVSTKYYYAFGCNLHQNVIHTIKSMPNVKWVLPDSHIRLGKNDYGGEPFIDGCLAPYDDMFHEDWLQDRSNNGFRKRTQTRRSRRKEHKNEL